VALIAAALYLGLSGGNVATERAFVMVAVMLGAIMLDRRALSLRAVAVAALIVLYLRPEALLGPGFQMSFAATTALVAVFQRLRGVNLGFGVPGLSAAMGVLLSSAVAGLATAPIGAAHFNAVSHYGLLANLLCVPVMGMLVIPSAVLAGLLAPLGLSTPALWLMGLGLDWILAVSHFVADLDGARSFVSGPPAIVLPAIALGMLFIILWQGRWRWIGAAPVCLAVGLWAMVERPAVLIAEGGTLVGVMTDAGRALSKAKGAGFVAQNWLENDGAPVEQADAAARWPKEGARLGGVAVLHVNGRKRAAAFKGCDPGGIVVASTQLEAASCTVFDPDRLRHTGALALRLTPTGYAIQSVRDVTGKRLWSQWPEDPPPQPLIAQTAAQ
jgi:competence protein ComEC